MMNKIYTYARNQVVNLTDSPAHFFSVAGLTTNVRVTRKNQKDAANDGDFTTRFKNAIQTLIDQGNYSRIVGIHADMDHRMHSMNGPVGTQRFLPWHRDYLLKFEAELRIIDSSLYVPYWDWITDREVPNWMQDFLPRGTTDLNGQPLPVSRFPGTNPDTPDLPTAAEMDQAMTRSTYRDFTVALEGLHNTVHSWVGGVNEDSFGIMNDIMYSPADPIFWLHHAFVDKQWSAWQQIPANAGLISQLAGADRVLDPWTETVDDVMSINDLGYNYA
jgi:tyrosinase